MALVPYREGFNSSSRLRNHR